MDQVPKLTKKCEKVHMERTLELHMPNWHETQAQCRQVSICWPVVVYSQSTLGSEKQPRALILGVGAYLLSNQEPTLDKPVQHFLAVAVGRLAGL